MSRKNYTVDEVLHSLSKKHDVKVTSDKTILMLNGKSSKFPRKDDCGNKTLGKIDFLCNYHGYRLIHVAEF